MWPGGRGQCGTKLAVKHICTQKTRVDSKIDQSYVKFFGYKERHSVISFAKRDLQPHLGHKMFRLLMCTRLPRLLCNQAQYLMIFYKPLFSAF